jgi:hypothetical protein
LHDEDELEGVSGGGGVPGARGRLSAAGLGAASAGHASAVPGREQLPAGEGVRGAAGAEARHHGRPQEADQELVRARRVQLLRRVLRAGARRPLPAHGGLRGPQPRRPRRDAARGAGPPVRPRRLPPQLQPLLRLPPRLAPLPPPPPRDRRQQQPALRALPAAAPLPPQRPVRGHQVQQLLRRGAGGHLRQEGRRALHQQQPLRVHAARQLHQLDGVGDRAGQPAAGQRLPAEQHRRHGRHAQRADPAQQRHLLLHPARDRQAGQAHRAGPQLQQHRRHPAGHDRQHAGAGAARRRAQQARRRDTGERLRPAAPQELHLLVQLLLRRAAPVPRGAARRRPPELHRRAPRPAPGRGVHLVPTPAEGALRRPRVHRATVAATSTSTYACSSAACILIREPW